MEQNKRLISALLLGILMTSLLPLLGTFTVQATASSTKFWALLVTAGKNQFDNVIYAGGDYMYHVINEHYDFDGIYYLNNYNGTIPGVNATATLDNTRSAITDWLYNTSGPNDVIFMYFNMHGGGYYDNEGGGPPYYEAEANNEHGGIPDSDGDEVDDNYDESLGFWNGSGWDRYLDDTLAADIADLSGNYSKLILVTQSCYGGGLVHDIQSKPRNESRVILTATSETLTSYLDLDTWKEPPEEDGYPEWSEAFIDALHGNNTYWDSNQREIVHQNDTLDDGKIRPDWNNDGHVTIHEAYNYAFARDDGRNATLLKIMIDALFPECPRYIVGEEPRIDNGYLAYSTWFPRKGERLLTVQTRLTNGTELAGVEFWIDDDPTVFSSPRTIEVPVGNHTIEIQDSITYGNYNYSFQHWDYNDSSDNPLNLNILENIILTAYYAESSPPGGPGGCPFIHVWNSYEYVIDNNLLPYSEIQGGTDVDDYYRLEQNLFVDKGKLKLMISEFEQEHSYLDRVQLLAVEHESDVSIAVSPRGEILTYKEPSPPAIAIDNNNEDVTSVLGAIDGDYYEGYAGDYILLDFGNIDVKDTAKLVMRADLPPEAGKWSVHVQLLNGTGGWETVAIVVPRVYWATEIVDLHDYLPDTLDELKARLYFTANHKIDYVGIDTTKQDDFELYYANLVSARHSVQDNVKEELHASDSVYTELLPGEWIELEFTLPENVKHQRTYILKSEGHYHTMPP
ncbi:MAG: hypothetical protein JSV05_03080 [Candidatus Bathyarchaeota archaeon]|nr:MAG: hypothetical protein JSV05_03080 [Candidatus Bathyarchaeota archaeon]